MNPWIICLLIGSFVPVPRVTSVTCEGYWPIVRSQAVLPKDLKVGPNTLAGVGRARKSKSLAVRVMDRLQQAEAHEAEPYYQQHIRQAWIIVSFLQKGVSNPFVQSSYIIYGKHPDLIWPAIVADRKARLCDEYFTWYTSDDVLRPDVPKIPSSAALPTSDTNAAIGANPTTDLGLSAVGPAPLKERIV